ncbi:hypothetical protein GCM10028808_08910 [Spirosoma migulaei]
MTTPCSRLVSNLEELIQLTPVTLLSYSVSGLLVAKGQAKEWVFNDPFLLIDLRALDMHQLESYSIDATVLSLYFNP